MLWSYPLPMQEERTKALNLKTEIIVIAAHSFSQSTNERTALQ